MGFKKIFDGLRLAFSMFTTLPFFRVHHFFEGINGYAVMFFPLVGLALGYLLMVIFSTLQFYIPYGYLSVAVFILWVGLTGALHLDGVADVFDALFVPKARREAVLKDPHIGAMGMIFTVLFILLKLALFVHIDESLLYLLPLVLMLARFNAVLAIFSFDYIRKDGMSSLAKKELTKIQTLLSTLFVITVSTLLGGMTALYMFVALFVMLFIIYLVATKLFGGFSGDLYGLLIESSEWMLLHFLMVSL